MKITTVVPAYKHKYLLDLLASLVQQSEPPDRVIFSDDSPDQGFTRILTSEPVRSLVAPLNVEVIAGPRRGAHANWAQCIQAWGGQTELLHILCDDDIVYPHFYQRHRQAHASGHFSASVSRRWYANETGQPLRQGLSVPPEVANHPHRLLSLDAGVLFATTVARATNWLGEVSNTVMRAETAQLIVQREYLGIPFAGLEDIGSFVCGALGQPLCFINEHLGFFRQSPNQNSAATMAAPMKCAILSYVALGLVAFRAGQIGKAQLDYCIDIVGQNALWHYRNEDDLAPLRVELRALMAGDDGAEQRYLQVWGDFVARYGNF